jgi:hypothetical protein
MKNTILYIFIAVLTMGGIASCKKSSYLTDGGLSDPKSPLSTYDYLKQHPYKLFDTLIMVIDHYQMKDEVNAAQTFFAPTNYSINRYIRLKRDSVRRIDEQKNYTLTNMYNDLSADSLRMYCIKSRVELMKAPLSATLTSNNANTQVATQRIQQARPGESWSSAPIYYLYFIKVVNGLDPAGTTLPENDPNRDLSSYCQTTGIEPSSGGMLHVLNNQHTFVRF